MASFALQMVHNVILTKLRAFSDFLEFAEQQKCKIGLFCSIYGQTTLTLQISLQTLWGKGFSGDLSFCPATPTQRLFKLHFYRDSGRTRSVTVVFSKSFGKTFQHFTNHGNLIGKVCISASAKLRLTKDKIEGTKLALVEVWVHFRVTNSGEIIGYGIANWALVA